MFGIKTINSIVIQLVCPFRLKQETAVQIILLSWRPFLMMSFHWPHGTHFTVHFWERRAYYCELLYSNVDFRTIAQVCIPAQQQRLSKCNSISYSDHGLLGSDALWFSRPPRVGSGSSKKKKKKFRPSNKGEAAKNLYTKSERPTLTRRVT